MKYKKSVWTMVIIVLIIAVIAYKNFSPKNELAETCSKITLSSVKEECFYNLAVKLGDQAICNKIEHGDRAGCMRDVAIKTKEKKTCDKILRQEIREECYYKLAVILRDEKLCEKILHWDKSGCLRDAVIEKASGE